MIVVPNVVCVAGVFFMGFGIATSVVTNNVSALLALGNGLLPLRKVARIESERRLRMEQELSVHAAETLIPD
jgi:Cu2+-exporting ATPase